jgi:hypothetical protein
MSWNVDTILLTCNQCGLHFELAKSIWEHARNLCCPAGCEIRGKTPLRVRLDAAERLVFERGEEIIRERKNAKARVRYWRRNAKKEGA